MVALRDKIKNKILILITYHINVDTQKISSQKSEVLLCQRTRAIIEGKR